MLLPSTAAPARRFLSHAKRERSAGASSVASAASARIREVDERDKLLGLGDFVGEASSARGVLRRKGNLALSYHIETYGCQMNVSDTEIVRSVLGSAGFSEAAAEADADVVLLNTCAIRENAEQKVWSRLANLRNAKLTKGKTTASGARRTVGVLGCMAERLKTRLVESDRLVDLVVGPDAYRDLPELVRALQPVEVQARMSGREGEKEEGDGDREEEEEELYATPLEHAVNVQLSADETYADIAPVRPHDDGGVSAFTTIMRGCNNMCSFCIVPFTRGRERR